MYACDFLSFFPAVDGSGTRKNQTYDFEILNDESHGGILNDESHGGMGYDTPGGG